MIKRAVFARGLGVPIIMHDYLTGGFTTNTSLAHYCRDNGILLHIHCAMHAVIDGQKYRGIHFRVLAKVLHMAGGDHIHSCIVFGKLEGKGEITLGFVDLLRDDFIEKDRSSGIYFTQGWVSLPSVMPMASGVISQKEGMAGDSDKHITRVLFCGPHFPASQTYTKEYLQNYSFIQVDDVPLADVPDVIANYHICVVKNMRLDSDIISRAKQMKLIMQFGVGLEGVNIDAATKNGIKVARIPGDITGNAASCAEMAIYLMLGLLRKQNEMQISVKQKHLGEPVGETLFGKTVFILGFGNIGIDLAKRLRPFGVKIIATKRSWASHSQACESTALPIQNGVIDDLVDEKGNHEDIYEFASRADIVVCCLSLNQETAGIVNKSFISSMRKGALLVNIARGALLDYGAVAYNLDSGHLGGLGIDVAWTEPFDPDDPILKFKNVIITPHVAGVTEHSYRTMAKVVGDVACQLHAGTPLTAIEFVN